MTLTSSAGEQPSPPVDIRRNLAWFTVLIAYRYYNLPSVGRSYLVK